MSASPVRPAGEADVARPALPSSAPGTLRTASLGVLKAGAALALMALFFTLFLLAPGPTAAGALLAIVLFELLRRR